MELMLIRMFYVVPILLICHNLVPLIHMCENDVPIICSCEDLILIFHMSENLVPIISSPEPLGSQGELIVYPSSRRPSVVRPSFSKILSSETAWPIKAKFYVEPSWEGGTKVYINCPGHMTKMAAMPIYGIFF